MQGIPIVDDTTIVVAVAGHVEAPTERVDLLWPRLAERHEQQEGLLHISFRHFERSKRSTTCATPKMAPENPMLNNAMLWGRFPQQKQMCHEMYPNVTWHLLPADSRRQFSVGLRHSKKRNEEI